MLSIILIYFIGKPFYNLAEAHYKNKWIFAILGVVTYYGGTFLGGFILGVFIAFGYMESLLTLPELVLGLLTLPFGLLACWGLYAILKNIWSKAVPAENNEALDGDFMQPGQ